MASYIPIDQIVQINPGVITAGSNPLALNGIFIGKNPLIASNKVMEFNSASAVAEWFGDNAYETELADVYFKGFANATKYPSALFFASYVDEARPAWARGATLKGMLFEDFIRTIDGEFFVTIGDKKVGGKVVPDAEGDSPTVGSSIKDCDNYSAVATFLTNLLGAENATVTWDPLASRYTITTKETGETATIAKIEGEAAIFCGFNDGEDTEVTNGISPNTLTEVLNMCQQECLNWATFSTVEQPTREEQFEMARWANKQNNGWLFVLSDNDRSIEEANNESCIGFELKDKKYEGNVPIYDPSERPLAKAFVMGTTASIDWNAYNGRIDFCFKSQTGLETSVRKGQIALNVLGNGYSFYGAHAGRGPDNKYNFFRNGQMHGQYTHVDQFVNQLFLNNQLRLSVMDMLLRLKSMPYNQEGYSYIRAACLDPIEQALRNGSIRTGVSISEAQRAQIISYVGQDVTNDIYANGWYLSIQDATAQTRSKRQSPPIMFLYTDGGSIQQIVIPSIVIL